MRPFNIGGVAVATLLIVTPAALAYSQDPAQAPAQPQAQTSSQTKDQAKDQAKDQSKKSETAAVQTFTGCLMSEPDYRKAHHLGAGALGGAGLGDEYVLVDVKVSPSAGASDMTSSSSTSSTTATGATTTCSDTGVAYRLTGKGEAQMKPLLGHEVAVQGRFKHADDVTASGETKPGEKLPAEIEIVSYREARTAAATAEPTPVTPPSSTPPSTTVDRTPTPTTPPATEPNELPHTASSTGIVVLFGILSLCSGVALTALRRRAL